MGLECMALLGAGVYRSADNLGCPNCSEVGVGVQPYLLANGQGVPVDVAHVEVSGILLHEAPAGRGVYVCDVIKVVADLHRCTVDQGRNRPAFSHNTMHEAAPQQEECRWLKVPCSLCEGGSSSLSQHFRCPAQAGGLQHKSEEPGCTSESIMVKLPPKNVCMQHNVHQVGVATDNEGQLQLASPDQVKADHAAIVMMA